MGKFHTDQSVPSTGTYHFAGHMEDSACQPTENEKRIQIVAWRNFSTLQTLQNWCILGNQTVKNHSIIRY